MTGAAEVAPLTLEKVLPPSGLTCHCTVGVGVPLAMAVKVKLLPALIVWLDGGVLIVGGTFTVSVAAPVVMLPMLLVKTASYSLPFCVASVVNISVVEVAPLTGLNVLPPSLLTCHCTVAAGLALAAAVKVAG